jgi:hypothetical protein
VIVELVKYNVKTLANVIVEHKKYNVHVKIHAIVI